MTDLTETLRKQGELHKRVSQALAHLDRDHAIHILCTWIGMNRLEKEVLPAIERTRR